MGGVSHRLCTCESKHKAPIWQVEHSDAGYRFYRCQQAAGAGGRHGRPPARRRSSRSPITARSRPRPGRSTPCSPTCRATSPGWRRSSATTLVDRSHGGLTEDGSRVVERARRVLRELDDIAADMAHRDGEVAGDVRLGMLGTTARWLLPRLLTDIASPTPTCGPIVAEGSTSVLIPALLSASTTRRSSTCPVDEPELVIEPLFAEDLLLLTGPDHPLAGATRSPSPSWPRTGCCSRRRARRCAASSTGPLARSACSSRPRPRSTACACSPRWPSTATARPSCRPRRSRRPRPAGSRPCGSPSCRRAWWRSPTTGARRRARPARALFAVLRECLPGRRPRAARRPPRLGGVPARRPSASRLCHRSPADLTGSAGKSAAVGRLRSAAMSLARLALRRWAERAGDDRGPSRRPRRRRTRVVWVEVGGETASGFQGVPLSSSTSETVGTPPTVARAEGPAARGGAGVDRRRHRRGHRRPRRVGAARRALVDCSGVVPTVVVVDGPAVSGPALLLGVADLVVMTEASYAFVNGPVMVAEFTGVQIPVDELGGAGEPRPPHRRAERRRRRPRRRGRGDRATCSPTSRTAPTSEPPRGRTTTRSTGSAPRPASSCRRRRPAATTSAASRPRSSTTAACSRSATAGRPTS